MLGAENFYDTCLECEVAWKYSWSELKLKCPLEYSFIRAEFIYINLWNHWYSVYCCHNDSSSLRLISSTASSSGMKMNMYFSICSCIVVLSGCSIHAEHGAGTIHHKYLTAFSSSVEALPCNVSLPSKHLMFSSWPRSPIWFSLTLLRSLLPYFTHWVCMWIRNVFCAPENSLYLRAVNCERFLLFTILFNTVFKWTHLNLISVIFKFTNTL